MNFCNVGFFPKAAKNLRSALIRSKTCAKENFTTCGLWLKGLQFISVVSPEFLLHRLTVSAKATFTGELKAARTVVAQNEMRIKNI
jgi:hypothetical protein